MIPHLGNPGSEDGVAREQGGGERGVTYFKEKVELYLVLDLIQFDYLAAKIN